MKTVVMRQSYGMVVFRKMEFKRQTRAKEEFQDRCRFSAGELLQVADTLTLRLLGVTTN